MAVNSMTGYGKGIAERDGLKVVVELKSVNHRFLDLMIKTPKLFNFSEDTIRKCMKESFARGHFDIFVNYEDTRQDRTSVSFDYSLVNAYVEAAKKISSEYFVQDTLSTAQIIALPDVAKVVCEDEDQDFLNNIVLEALKQAIENISKMRASEGVLMQNDVMNKMATIKDIVKVIEEKAPGMVEEHFAKVKERVQEMLKDVAIDEAKLLNEIAFYTDKVCVDEEIQRLKSHLDHFAEIISKGGACGKQLDFIVQEMNREANTCGSKCNNIEVSNQVIALKNEIEKVREQIQNIE
ncbi:MAG: YicC family protein [Clostridia bacterium]|nr:YicC family protein [Clostridia bacterium]